MMKCVLPNCPVCSGKNDLADWELEDWDVDEDLKWIEEILNDLNAHPDAKLQAQAFMETLNGSTKDL